MVLYFTGTGNSRYIAERIAKALDDELFSINDRIKAGSREPVDTGSRVVIVAPTYAWRLPVIVSEWIAETDFTGAEKIWFVMDCGAQIGNAAKYNRALSDRKKMQYMGTAQIIMPENYIAMFPVPDSEEADQIIADAEPDIDDVIARISATQEFAKPRNNILDRMMSGPANRVFYPFCVRAHAFAAGDGCISCGRCVELCPLNNVQLKDGRSVWGKDCTHCMACIAYCPTECIEYGKKSIGKPRYYFVEK